MPARAVLQTKIDSDHIFPSSTLWSSKASACEELFRKKSIPHRFQRVFRFGCPTEQIVGFRNQAIFFFPWTKKPIFDLVCRTKRCNAFQFDSLAGRNSIKSIEIGSKSEMKRESWVVKKSGKQSGKDRAIAHKQQHRRFTGSADFSLLFETRFDQ